MINVEAKLLKRSLMAALCLAACDTGGDETGLAIDLYTADGQNALLDGSGADIIELVIVNADDPFAQPLKEEVTILDGKGSIGPLPVGQSYQLFARGYRGSENTPRFYGATLPFGVAAGDDQKVAVQIGQVDCVGLNRGSSLRVPEGKDDMVALRAGMTGTALLDGRVLFTGGAEYDGQGNIAVVNNSVEIYDPNKGQFIQLDVQLREPRAFHTATLLESGQVLLAGGITGGSAGNVTVTGSASLIEVTADGAEVRALPDAFEPGMERYGHEAVKLGDARNTVLITGGTLADGTPLASTYRYFPSQTGDPTGGSWRRQGDLRTARVGQATAPLSRTAELAVVSGGLDADGASDSIEVFTVNPEQSGCTDDRQVPGPDVGCFIRPRERRLNEARWGHKAVPVDGGRQILFLGGYSDANRQEQPTGLEMMDQVLLMQSGAEVGSLRFGRGDMSATVLPDGSVLVAGGRRGDQPTLVTTRLQPRRGQGTNGSEVVLGYGLVELAQGCEMSEARYGHQAVLMASGTVMLTGGVSVSGGVPAPSRRAEVYFPQVVRIETYYP